MKRSAMPLNRQMNPPLLEAPATTAASGDQQKELTLALMELLINAAQGGLETQANGEDFFRTTATGFRPGKSATGLPAGRAGRNHSRGSGNGRGSDCRA